MTVVDPLTSSVGGGMASAATNSSVAVAANAQVSSAANAGVYNGGGAAASAGSAGNANPLMLKTKEEILTSLHLIKDIRRLETYQRDFFLKVRAGTGTMDRQGLPEAHKFEASSSPKPSTI